MCNFIKKETPPQVLSCESYEIFKNTYFEEHLRTDASKLFALYLFYMSRNFCCVHSSRDPLELFLLHENIGSNFFSLSPMLPRKSYESLL